MSDNIGTKRRQKVAVALSGGLDSSVVCLLLKEQGYDVVAVTAKMFDNEYAELIVKNAKNVAEKLGIPHYVLDFSEKFQKEVVDYFENEYMQGRTPNPCIMCNRCIKWGALFDFVINELDCDYVASGHYAKIVDDNGVKKLYPAKDEKKDQQYYLFELSQSQLEKILFPLFGYVKDEIRQIAIDNDLPPKSSKESQDICFIRKPMTTKKYLVEKFGVNNGDFVFCKTGAKMGTHEGFWQYTIGQRKGIGIAYTEPLYVVDLDAKRNIVYLGTKEDLMRNSLEFENLHLQYELHEKEFVADVKIRYNMQPQKGRVFIENDNCGRIIFDNPVSSVTSGQAVVFYEQYDKHLIGGGWIK